MRRTKAAVFGALVLAVALVIGVGAPNHTQAQTASPTLTAGEVSRMLFLWRTPDGTLWVVANAAGQHIRAITPKDIDDSELNGRIIDPPAPDGWMLYPTTPPVVVTATPAAIATTQAEPVIVTPNTRALLGSTALTVTNVSRASLVGKSTKPALGNVYLIVEVQLEGLGPDAARYAGSYFRVRDGSGYEYSTLFWIGDPLPHPLLSGALNRGETVKGQIAFEVPNGANGLLLIPESPSAYGTSLVRVRLD